VLGCGCGLVIVLAVVVFGAIGFFTKEAARRQGVTTDTTVVAPDTGSYSKPGDDASSTESTESTEKPSDKPTDDSGEPDERGLKEIRPVTGDSAF
jgi:hypothetical protein